MNATLSLDEAGRLVLPNSALQVRGMKPGDHHFLTNHPAPASFRLPHRRSTKDLPMKPPGRIDLESRAAEKMASRREDRLRLEKGESPAVIQRENSIFPPGYFKKHRIMNFASVIGK